MTRLEEIRAIVDEQAEDEGLWFIAKTAPEGYLQQALRRLHEAIEGVSREQCAFEAVLNEYDARIDAALKAENERLRGLLKEASLYVRTMLDEEIDKEIERQKDGIATDFDEPMVNLLHRIDAALEGRD